MALHTPLRVLQSKTEQTLALGRAAGVGAFSVDDERECGNGR